MFSLKPSVWCFFSMDREDLAYVIAIYNLFWNISVSVYGMEKEYQSDYFRRL